MKVIDIIKQANGNGNVGGFYNKRYNCSCDIDTFKFCKCMCWDCEIISNNPTVMDMIAQTLISKGMHTPLTPREMVTDYLSEHGYDGLYYQEESCSCECGDLFLCAFGPKKECMAGYLGEDEDIHRDKRDEPKEDK